MNEDPVVQPLILDKKPHIIMVVCVVVTVMVKPQL